MTPSKIVQLPQGSIQYIEHGQGQPVVFVHGLMVDNKIWQPLPAELGPQLRCILPNWPLGAHSMAMHADADLSVPGVVRLIADFIAALDLHEVVLVGNDTGGALAQMVCARFPERISRLVLTTCDAYDVFPPPAFAALKWLGHIPPLARLTVQSLYHVSTLRKLPFAFGDLTDGPLDNALIDEWLTPARMDDGVHRDTCKFLRTLSNRYTQQAGAALRHFDKPVLLLWSSRCRHFPKRLAERFQRELSNVELHWIDSAGVLLSLEYAQLVGERIRAFVEIEAGTRRGAAA